MALSFIERPLEALIHKIYTDGGITFKTKTGSFAVVVIDPEGDLIAAYAKRGYRTTSNVMEMRGVYNALRWAQKNPDKEVEIITDSQYTQRTLTEWVHGWKANGWTKSGGFIHNIKLWQKMEALYSSLNNVRVSWIKGHAGHEFNELADRICTKCKNGENWRDELNPYFNKQFPSILG